MLSFIAAGSGIVCLAATLIASLRLVAVYRRLPEYFPQQIGWDGELVGVGSRRSFALLYALFGAVYLGSILNDASMVFLAGPGAAQNTVVMVVLLFTIALAAASVFMLVNAAAVTQNALSRPPTPAQCTLFRWVLRSLLGVGLGIVFEMSMLAARTSGT